MILNETGRIQSHHVDVKMKSNGLHRPLTLGQRKKIIQVNAHPFLFLSLFVCSVSITRAFTTSFSGRPPMLNTIYKASCHHHNRAMTLSVIPQPSEGGENREGYSTFDADAHVLHERLNRMHAAILELEMNQPPNPTLSPIHFVRQILQAIRNPDEPLPDAGFRLLLRSSSEEWRRLLLQSVGAPDSADETWVASALGSALSRPQNQFGILIDSENNEEHRTEGNYRVLFPGEPLDFMDGTCWLTCQLRGEDDGSLLVTMGWQLIRRPEDGAWIIDHINWRDFRKKYKSDTGKGKRVQTCR